MVALLRAELANLGADLDLASEATNLQIAIRRAEFVDDPAPPVNDATWIENSRSGIMHMAWICGMGYMRSLGVQSAAGDSRRRRSTPGLLGDEVP